MTQERKSLWGKCPDATGRFQRTQEGISINGKLIKWVDFEMPGFIIELARKIADWENGLGPCEMMFVMDAFAKHPKESRDEAFGIIYESFAKSLDGGRHTLPPFLQDMLSEIRGSLRTDVPISVIGIPSPEMLGQARKVVEEKVAEGTLDLGGSKKIMDRHPDLNFSALGLYGIGLMRKEDAERMEEACRKDPELTELIRNTMKIALQAFPEVSGRPNPPEVLRAIKERIAALGQPKLEEES